MSKFDKEKFGKRLRAEREKLSLSQEELAEKIGTTPGNVSRWEKGATFPNFYFRRQLYEIFGESLPIIAAKDAQRSSDPAPDDIVDEFHSVFYFNIPRLPGPAEFYGRRKERMILRNRLHHKASTSLVGPRRIGKTWLLHYLQCIVPTKADTEYDVGYIDATLPRCHTMIGLATSILETLKIAPVDNSTLDEHLIKLEQALIDAQGKVFVLCIDEFEGVCATPDFDMTFLESLRALANYGLCLVTASRSPLQEVIREKMGPDFTSPFFNIFSQMQIKPFDKSEAEDFAAQKSKQAGFTVNERDYLLKFGQEDENTQEWYPMRLQLAGLMIQEDTYFSEVDPAYQHNPQKPGYWQVFKERLQERYGG
ncbi:MAG: helix-turn-helix domain-containing protein [Ktedonobacteraceae bacterium]|nr:helix-turn-helix domain-containing protein [Ktedonobacteraceae bacterium]